METPHIPFTAEEICEQAKGNVNALALVFLAYAREQGQPLAEAARFVGRVLAPTWDEVEARQARETAQWAALNVVTSGGALRRLNGDARRAEVVLAGWPKSEDLALIGLSQTEADTLHDLYGPIAERLGLRYAWRREGDELIMTFEAMP